MNLKPSHIFARVAIVTALLHPTVAVAQSVNDPTPIQGNMVTETAAGISIRSANGGYGTVDNSPESQAQKRRVNNLITQYGNCRASARQYSQNKAAKDAFRAQCVRKYQPQFAKACVDRAMSIAICTKLNRRGTIE
jgi:hypothetical protein